MSDELNILNLFTKTSDKKVESKNTKPRVEFNLNTDLYKKVQSKYTKKDGSQRSAQILQTGISKSMK